MHIHIWGRGLSSMGTHHRSGQDREADGGRWEDHRAANTGHGHSVSLSSCITACSQHPANPAMAPSLRHPHSPNSALHPSLAKPCLSPPSRPSLEPLQWQNRSYMRAEMTLHKALTEVDKAYGRDHPMFSRCLLQVAGMAITQVWKE